MMNAKKLDWSGFEPEAFPVQGGRYTRFNYQPPLTMGSIQFECNKNSTNFWNKKLHMYNFL